jgi:hypothetical protein
MSKEIQGYGFKKQSEVPDCKKEYGNQVAFLSSVVNQLNTIYDTISNHVMTQRPQKVGLCLITRMDTFFYNSDFCVN